MKKIIQYSSVLLFLLFFSCQPDNLEWKPTYKGKFNYKIISNSDQTSQNKDTIGFGDLVHFHYVLRNGDKVIESSYSLQELVELDLPAKPGRNQFMEALTLARQGDSLIVKIKYEDALDDLSTYKEDFKKGDIATFAYKIISVESRAMRLQKAESKHALKMGYNGIEEMKKERKFYTTGIDSIIHNLKTSIALKKEAKLALEKGAEGLQIYHREKVETGQAIQTGDTVFVFYLGLVEKDAQIFDDILIKKGERLAFTVGDSSFQVPMFHKSILGLQKGSKATIFVPSKLGYGKEGSGKTIPPNADLVLYIDVVAVHPKQ